MASKQSAQGDGSGNRGEVGMIIFAIVMGMLLLPLYLSFLRPYAARIVTAIATYECTGVLLFHALLPTGYAQTTAALVRHGHQLLAIPGIEQFRTMTPAAILNVLSFGSRPYAYLLFPVMLLMAWHLRQTDIRRRFRRTFDLDKLIRHFVSERPFLKPIAEVDPTKLDPFKGPWRIRHTFISFAIEHRLLLDGRDRPLKAPPENSRAANFDMARATQVYTALLGKPYRGVDQLTPTQQAMFGILAALIARKRKDAVAANDAIAGSFTANKKTGACTGINLKPGIDLARKYAGEPEVVKLIKQHHYVLPLFMALKRRAMQRAGRFGTGQYLWLRPIDRHLYLTIHQTGLDAPNIETASVYSHWHAEMVQRLPAQKPVVLPAVLALRQHLIDETWLMPNAQMNRDPAGDASQGDPSPNPA